jgi:methyl-accepting chemotaxis protein
MEDGKCVGAIFAGSPTSVVDNAIMQAMGNIVIIGLVSGCVFVTVAIKISRRLAKKLKEHREKIGTLALNDLTIECEKIEKPSDEIDVINNETADFIAHLRSIVKNIRSASHSLNSVSDELADGMNVAYNSSDEISSAIQNIASGAENQSQDAQNITQKVEQIGDQIDSIRDSMASLADTSKRMLEVKEDTLVSVDRAKTENEAVEENIREINSQIAVTSKSMN